MGRTQDQFYSPTPSLLLLDEHGFLWYRTRTHKWYSTTSTTVELQGMVKGTRKDGEEFSRRIP
jgi:hypothetical protein